MWFRLDVVVNLEIVDKNYVVLQLSGGLDAADMWPPRRVCIPVQADLIWMKPPRLEQENSAH